MTTGFEAYCLYVFIKQIHFKDNTFNVMNLKKTPMGNKLIKSWNDNRRNKDGLSFQKIESKFNKIKPLARLYSSYYINNPNFYIQDLFDDEFHIYKNNMNELKMIKDVFTNDLLDIISHIKIENTTTKELFVSNSSIPQIFKMGLSFNSLVIMDDIFDIVKLNEKNKINTLEKERWKQLKLLLKWYKPIIQKYLNENNWKELTKQILKN